MQVYLDHQSATPLLAEVREAMEPYLREHFGSASSLHRAGLMARDAIARARGQVAGLVRAESPDDIIFTASGTEALNLAMKGAAFANQRRGRHIVYSAAEQPAVTASIAWLLEHGFTATRVPVDPSGLIDPQQLAASLQPDTILVCVHHSNLDIGAIQPVAAIGEITSQRRILLVVDAVASAGWIGIDAPAQHIDLLACSPGRFYGPKGAGILYRHRRARIQNLIHGGDQEHGRRAGTENVAAIVGAGVAAERAARDGAAWGDHTRALQRKAVQALFSRVPYLQLNGPAPGPLRHPANLNVSVEFVDGEGLALMLDMKGIALGAGAACVTKSMRIPPVLAAIGLPEALAKGNVILSFGKDNTEAEVDYLVETFAKTVSTLREMSPLWDDFQKGLIRSEISPAY